MPPSIDVPLKSLKEPPLLHRGFGETQRTDLWWLQPLLVFLGLGAFVVYSTWAAFQGQFYQFGPYLSPMYSPLLAVSRPGWWPAFIPFSAAFLVLWAPGGFRLTCYYYRGAYYKAFWADPATCAVGEPRKSYWGERKWPLLIQNIHRYFLYLALIILVFLFHDFWVSMWWTHAMDPSVPVGHTQFEFRIGAIVMFLDFFLLAGYTFGCHSLRHLIGGHSDVMGNAKKGAWSCVSCLNNSHGKWAWASLVWVMFTDIYVRLCAMGVWHDLTIWRVH